MQHFGGALNRRAHQAQRLGIALKFQLQKHFRL